MNPTEQAIAESILTELKMQNLLSKSSLEKLLKSIQSGKMKMVDWISIFENDRPDANGEQHESE